MLLGLESSTSNTNTVPDNCSKLLTGATDLSGQRVWLSTMDPSPTDGITETGTQVHWPRFNSHIKVAQHINPVTCISKPMRVCPTFHVSLLKPFYTCPLAPPSQSPPPPRLTDGQLAYTMRRLLDCRRARGALYMYDFKALKFKIDNRCFLAKKSYSNKSVNQFLACRPTHGIRGDRTDTDRLTIVIN